MNRRKPPERPMAARSLGQGSTDPVLPIPERLPIVIHPCQMIMLPKGRREMATAVPVVVFCFLFGWAESAPIAVTATPILTP
jgi:hypothetical protein